MGGVTAPPGPAQIRCRRPVTMQHVKTRRFFTGNHAIILNGDPLHREVTLIEEKETARKIDAAADCFVRLYDAHKHEGEDPEAFTARVSSLLQEQENRADSDTEQRQEAGTRQVQPVATPVKRSVEALRVQCLPDQVKWAQLVCGWSVEGFQPEDVPRFENDRAGGMIVFPNPAKAIIDDVRIRLREGMKPLAYADVPEAVGRRRHNAALNLAEKIATAGMKRTAKPKVVTPPARNAPVAKRGRSMERIRRASLSPTQQRVIDHMMTTGNPIVHTRNGDRLIGYGVVQSSTLGTLLELHAVEIFRHKGSVYWRLPGAAIPASCSSCMLATRTKCDRKSCPMG